MNPSPLRYPGGKYKISSLVASIIKRAHRIGGVYVEPFAGGAGVALELLLSNQVRKIVINDSDKAIYSIWRAILTEPLELIDRLINVKVNVAEWERQREVYRQYAAGYSLDLAFAALFLNRTNRSGILTAGPIGGVDQGSWKLDVRFNKDMIKEKIERISRHRNDIKLYGKDIFSFINGILPKLESDTFIYFDPPYYKKGKALYKNYFTPEKHAALAEIIARDVVSPWIVSYDNVPEIRNLYRGYSSRELPILYSLANKGLGSEIMFFSSSQLSIGLEPSQTRIEVTNA